MAAPARTGNETAPMAHGSVPITIASGLADAPGASGVAATLGTYFWGINNRQWQTVWQQFTAEGQRRVGSIEQLAVGNATSYDFNVTIHAVAPLDATTLQVFVTFTSTQDAAYGPNGDTCDNWTLDYTFKLVNSSWLIDRSSPHNGISSQACNYPATSQAPATGEKSCEELLAEWEARYAGVPSYQRPGMPCGPCAGYSSRWTCEQAIGRQ